LLKLDYVEPFGFEEVSLMGEIEATKMIDWPIGDPIDV